MKLNTLLSICLRAVFCLVLLLSAHKTYGQTVKAIDLSTGKFVESFTTPKLKCISSERGGKIIMSYYIDSVQLYPNHTNRDFYYLNVDGLVENENSGEPSSLMRYESFIIPNNMDVEIKMIDSSYIDIPLKLAAAREPLVDGEINTYTEAVYNKKYSKGFYPHTIIGNLQNRLYRGNSIIDICVYPTQYDIEKECLRVYKSIIYEVTLKNSLRSFKSSSNGDIVQTPKLLNNTSIKSLSPSSLTEDYLIITVPKYVDAANRLANWKRTLGFNTIIVQQNAWGPQTIKNAVSEVYNNCENLQYLLIIGDHNDVPADYILSGQNPHHTDMYYACMDGGDDYTADLYYGRLSVNDASEAAVVVDKIINYEKSPILDNNFYNTALHVAFYQDDNINSYEDKNFVGTSEMIRNYISNIGKTVKRQYFTYWMINPLYYNDGSPIPNEIKRPNYDWLGDSTRINQDINNGAFYLLYRGHGLSNSFGFLPYNTNNIQNLANGNKLPVVFSICCQNGNFPVGDCLTEVFLKKENGGCVGIVGATEDSMSSHNDQLSKGIFNAIWPGLIPGSSQNPCYRLGEILSLGENNMSKNSYYRYQLELYHIFGDPSMMIYTSKPTIFQNVSISKNASSYNVNLGLDTGTISCWDLQSNLVTKYEGSTASFPNSLHDVVICVSAHNKIPYIYHSNLGTTYIQNDVINGVETFVSNSINVGSNVTSNKPIGPVVFDGIKTTLRGNTVEINGETTINLGTEFEILPIE